MFTSPSCQERLESDRTSLGFAAPSDLLASSRGVAGPQSVIPVTDEAFNSPGRTPRVCQVNGMPPFITPPEERRGGEPAPRAVADHEMTTSRASVAFISSGGS